LLAVVLARERVLGCDGPVDIVGDMVEQRSRVASLVGREEALD
jgi:hypothetical protein